MLYRTTEEYILARVQRLENENVWLSDTIKENEKNLETCHKLIDNLRKEKVNNDTKLELLVALLKDKVKFYNGKKFISFELVDDKEDLYHILIDLLELKENENE